MKTFSFIYTTLVIVLFLFCAMIWHWQMAGTYFVCQHKGLIMDFIPPFTHPGANGDFYLKPQSAVYTIWSIYVAITIVLPAVGAWFLMRLHERALNKAW